VDLLLDDCTHYQGSLYHALELGIFKMLRLNVGRADWPETLPPHLTMRYLLYDISGRTIATGRILHKLSQNITTSAPAKITPNKKISDSIKQWQNRLFQKWDFEGLEPKIALFTTTNELAGYLYPALHVEKNRGGVTITFESDLKTATHLNKTGSLFLYQLHFKDQFKSLKNYCPHRPFSSLISLGFRHDLVIEQKPMMHCWNL